MPRGYPDWMVGQDPQEGARRSIMGVSGGRTGQVLWSTDFEDGLTEFGNPSMTWTGVELTTLAAYHGSTSVKLSTPSTPGYYFGLQNDLQPADYGKFGFEYYFYSLISDANAYQRLVTGLDFNYGIGANNRLGAEIRISRVAGIDGMVEVFSTGGAWVDTGICAANLFLPLGSAYIDYGWNHVKFVMEIDKDNANYVRMEINGKDYDLSTFPIYRASATEPRSYIRPRIYIVNIDTVVKSILFDSFTATYNEP